MNCSLLLAVLFLSATVIYTPPAFARNSNYCHTCERDANGRIKRDPAVKKEFRKSNPCPSTGKISGKCDGYVIDHRHALRSGGADSVGNMQWQTKEAAREKDQWE